MSTNNDSHKPKWKESIKTRVFVYCGVIAIWLVIGLYLWLTGTWEFVVLLYSVFILVLIVMAIFGWTKYFVKKISRNK